MSTTQRKRRGGAVNSRQARRQSRLASSTAEMSRNEAEASRAEPIEPASVPHADIALKVNRLLFNNQQLRRILSPLRCQRPLKFCIMSSSDEDELSNNDVPSGTVSCPICMDGYSEIVQSGRLIVSTKCGHVFCSQCLRDSLRNASSCPTCRKKLTHRQYHPIYI
ncbi:E3 ubiquitin-protein ligase RNF4 [Falco biarmicus]|uniref:E3 ubiquitin-protein ligase RNF4 n=1 Tax=Falco rusticolus TaxID=120794 RepID=UPI0006B6B3BE|nr:E3 ubiquitin-protein ligase RNF4 [Falco rusticolus]XP_055556731.1 E3 ubiquitin-protein ligase RNF4-like [Falco cherrug]XP_056181529.1 E3 ubiquitin-protein ligase RNF4 [Falco biarmicus]